MTSLQILGYISDNHRRGSVRVAFGCFIGVIAALASYFTSGATEAPGARVANADALPHVMLTLAAVILLGQVLSRLFSYLDQPPVIGEVVAGIILGPSVLGERGAAWLLPPDAAPFLGIVAQIGVLLYMFLVGLELDMTLLAGKGRSTIAISNISVIVPFAMGSLLAIPLHERLAGSNTSLATFILFLGVAMSITAFPVLARILTDRKMSRTPLGVIALSCAAVDDVTAWCLLALATGVAQARPNAGFRVFALAAAYIAVMLLAARPLAVRLVSRVDGRPDTHRTLAITFTALLLSALATEWIGIHAIFGAFLLGAIIPHNSSLARSLTSQLTNIVTILLLPAFFALTGMRTRISLLSGVDLWLLCGAITLVATLGKFGGTLFAARFTGLSWRDSAALGALMNTRGLMELIVLNVGLDLNVISPRLFAMMILMALATTMSTAPALRWLGVYSQPSRDPQERGADLEESSPDCLQPGFAEDE